MEFGLRLVFDKNAGKQFCGFTIFVLVLFLIIEAIRTLTHQQRFIDKIFGIQVQKRR
jgi:Ca2+/Na+ antiporter